MEVIPEGFRKCKKCGEVKPFKLFVKNKGCSNGIAHTCICCRRIYDLSRIDKLKEFSKNYRNSDKYKKYISSDSYKKRHNAACKKYNQSDKGISRMKKINNTPEKKEYMREYRKLESYKEKKRDGSKLYREQHIEDYKLYRKKISKELSDSYVRSKYLNRKHLEIPKIPKELIQLKRMEIKLKRFIKSKTI